MILLLFYLLATIATAYANWLVYLPPEDPRTNNSWIYNLLFLVTCLALAYFFNHTLLTRSHKVIVVVSLVIVLAVFVNEYLSGRHGLFNSLSTSLSCFFIVVCCFLYFYQALSNIREQSILRQFDFWLVSGFLLYFLGNFFIVLAWQYLSSIYKDPLTQEQAFQFTILWSVHNILLLISAVTTLIAGLWINYQRKSPLLL
jgi:hypothetical protein